jgi:O-antigen/teichoic acid export membrane protein
MTQPHEEQPVLESHSKKVATGALVLMVFRFASGFLYVCFFILLGNRAWFSDEAFGRFDGLLAMTNMFFILTDFGLEVYLTRELARDKEEFAKKLPGIVTLKTALTLLAGLALTATLLVGPGGTAGVGVLAGAASVSFLFTLSAQAFIRSISRAEQAMRVEGMMALVEKGVIVTLGSSLLWLGADVGGVMSAVAFANLCAALYGWLRIRRYGLPLYPGFPILWKVLVECLPFGLSAICVLMFFNMDRIMLFYFGEVWVARYSRGFRIVMGLLLFPQMMSIAIYPALSRLKENMAERVNVGRESLQTLCFVAFPLVAGGWMVAGPLVDLLYGAAPQGALSWRWDARLGSGTEIGNTTEAAVLRILLLSLPFTCGNYLFGPALNALDKQVWNLWSSAATLVANVALNLLLIPTLGPVGAAIATTLTQATYCGSMYWGLRKLDDTWLRGNRLLTILACSLAMAGLLAVLPVWHPLARIALAAAFYFGMTWVLGVWPYRLGRGRAKS